MVTPRSTVAIGEPDEAARRLVDPTDQALAAAIAAAGPVILTAL